MSIFSKFFRGERVSLSDMDHTARRSQQLQIETENQTVLLTNKAGQPTTFVLYGLELSIGTNAVVVAKGAVLGSFTQGAETIHGQVGVQAITTQIPTSLVPTSTDYGVWTRLELVDTEVENRGAWNELHAGSPVEYARSGPTRSQLIPVYTIEQTDLSLSGWTRLGLVDISGGVPSNIRDRRQMFIEGDMGATPQGSAAGDWGGASGLDLDRNDNRSIYGVKGVRHAFRAVFRQLAKLQGSTNEKWWKLPTKGVDELLDLAGSREMTGDLRPDASNIRDLGALGGFDWRNSYVNEYRYPAIINGGLGKPFTFVVPGLSYKYELVTMGIVRELNSSASPGPDAGSLISVGIALTTGGFTIHAAFVAPQGSRIRDAELKKVYSNHATDTVFDIHRKLRTSGIGAFESILSGAGAVSLGLHTTAGGDNLTLTSLSTSIDPAKNTIDNDLYRYEVVFGVTSSSGGLALFDDVLLSMTTFVLAPG